MKESARFFTPSFLTKITRSCLWMGIFGILAQSCSAADDDGRPSEHLCPITYEVMKDPVVAADGYSYERSAIETYLKSSGNARSPMTGLPLPNKTLVPNQALRIMIGEWTPNIFVTPSPLASDAETLAKRIREEFQRNAALLNSSRDKHIVAFLGNTGAGKSTLVNLLAGKTLVVSDDEEDYVLANPQDATAMPIGRGGHSETIYPKFIDVGNLRFFDLPGFNDTDGSERNLMNAAFIRKILLDAASVRLVFVAGQDQFTADRSASVRQLFDSIRQLFVVDERNINLVDDGIFVATKVTCAPQADITDFLSRRTDSRDKAALNQQLKLWNHRNQLGRMFHPLREAQNKGVREHILGLIQNAKSARIRGLNVSVLYPPDTKEPLERMFFSVLENAFNRNLSDSLATLSGQECYSYDQAIASYKSDAFWSTFDASVRTREEAIELLKEFCVNPYHKALKRFEEGNERKRQDHIKVLGNRREARIKEIEREFFSVLKAAFESNLGISLKTLSDYDKALDSWGSNVFWPTFAATTLAREDMGALLEKFCKGHYENALRTLERENERKRQEYIKTLKGKRQARVEDIERRTEEKVRKAIASIIVPGNAGDDFVAFDFAFHKDYYDQVFAPDSMRELAADTLEQEAVRRYYASFISRHSHEQMMRWHQRFGNSDVSQQLVKMEAAVAAQSEKTRELEGTNQDLKEELEETAQRAIVLQNRLEETQTAATVAQMQAEERLTQMMAAIQENAQVVASLQAKLQALESRETRAIQSSSSFFSIKAGPSIPPIAHGYESIYERFLRGVLVYRPNQGSDFGMVTLPIRELANPLEGTFDLSRCGDTGKYLSIATGYRKGKKPENKDKVEIWFAPRFLIERELDGTASHFKPIMANWKQDAPVGMFWTWGGWDNMSYYDYLTTENMDNLSKITLYENYKKARERRAGIRGLTGGWCTFMALSGFVCELK